MKKLSKIYGSREEMYFLCIRIWNRYRTLSEERKDAGSLTGVLAPIVQNLSLCMVADE